MHFSLFWRESSTDLPVDVWTCKWLDGGEAKAWHLAANVDRESSGIEGQADPTSVT